MKVGLVCFQAASFVDNDARSWLIGNMGCSHTHTHTSLHRDEMCEGVKLIPNV